MLRSYIMWSKLALTLDMCIECLFLYINPSGGVLNLLALDFFPLHTDIHSFSIPYDVVLKWYHNLMLTLRNLNPINSFIWESENFTPGNNKYCPRKSMKPKRAFGTSDEGEGTTTINIKLGKEQSISLWAFWWNPRFACRSYLTEILCQSRDSLAEKNECVLKEK